ncbi:hypothetical protein OROMI_027562 [Orobanche minor]
MNFEALVSGSVMCCSRTYIADLPFSGTVIIYQLDGQITCGGANVWEDVSRGESMFCSAGSYYPTSTQEIPCQNGISAAWDLNECLLLHLRFVFMEASSYHFVLMEAAAFCINSSCIPHALCKATTSYVIDNEGEPIPDVAEQHMVDCCIGNEADPKGRECTTSSFPKGDRFLKNVGVYKTYKTEDYGKYTS